MTVSSIVSTSSPMTQSSPMIINGIAIPKEIMSLIASFLDHKDLFSLGLTSRAVSFLFLDVPLWRAFLHKHFPDSYTKLGLNDPKRLNDPKTAYQRLSVVARNMATGTCQLRTLTEHQNIIKGIIVYNDKLISTSTKDDLMMVWDLNTGQILDRHQGGAWCIVIWNGKLILGAMDNTIKVWDPNTKQAIKTLIGHRDDPTSRMVVYGDRLISSCYSDPILKVWDLKTEKCWDLDWLENPISDIAVWEDKIIASASEKIIIWEPETRTVLRTFTNGNSKSITCLIVYDNKLIFGSTDKLIRIWDLKAKKMLLILTGHNAAIYCIAVWDNKIISGSRDETIRIWDLNTGLLLRTIQVGKVVHNVIVCEGKIISGLPDGTINIWDFNAPSYSQASRIDCIKNNLKIDPFLENHL